MIAVIGLPVAYAATRVWGAQVLAALNRVGRLNITTLVLAGVVGGTLVAFELASARQGSMFRLRLPLPAGATLGALVAASCWWAGSRPRELRHAMGEHNDQLSSSSAGQPP